MFDRETELAILYEISAITAQVGVAERVYELAVEKAVRPLNAELVVLYRYDPATGCLEAAASHGVPLRRVIASFPPAQARALLERPLRGDGGPLPAPDDPVAARYPVRAALGLPLASASEPLGWLYVARVHVQPFADAEADLFHALARQVSGALELLSAREREQRQREHLEAANARLTTTLAEVQRLYDEQRRLLDTINELSTPVLRISARALLFPLIGMLDARRLDQAAERVLGAIAELQAELVIIDVTSVPVVDSQVAASLLQLSRAARLLGARVWISGVRPEVAQVIVALGIEMGELRFVSNLADAVAQVGRL